MTGRLQDKVAIVCGSGQTPGATVGNGRATAVLFAREGAHVLAVDRDQTAVLQTCEQIASEGFTARSLVADITNPDDRAAIAHSAIDHWGHIDILHNNIGISIGDGNTSEVSEHAWNHIFDVNLTSTWAVCRQVIPHMRDRGSGAITNVSSIAAVCVVPMAAYKVSKAGVNALTQALAMDNAEFGIRVNAIMPGLIDTPMAIEGNVRATGIDEHSLRTARNKTVPLNNRQGTAWDVAYAALFLASNEASFITGAILPVDGGQT
ncbi:SDR family NAD(P)-dependent oxidoreductase, partial [Mycobacteroides chelonae]